jgi:hypothetical protein
VFINFAKSQRDSDDEDDKIQNGEDNDDDDDEIGDEEGSISEQELDAENDLNDTKVVVDNSLKDLNNQNQVRVNGSNMDEFNISESPINDAATLATIKSHFNSLKKSRHIRKTSSAKSQHRKQSQRSRKSQKSIRSRSSTKRRNGNENGEVGFTNLAYEIEYKNSDAYELPMHESFQDSSTSINEDGEYFSKF